MLFETCMYSCKHRVFHLLFSEYQKTQKTLMIWGCSFTCSEPKIKVVWKQLCSQRRTWHVSDVDEKRCTAGGKKESVLHWYFHTVISSCQICPELGNQTVDVLVTNPPLRLSVCSSSCTASRNPFCWETSCIIFWKPLTWWLLTWHINV